MFNVLPSILAVIGTAGIIIICMLAIRFWPVIYDAILLKVRWINKISYRKMLIIIAAISFITKMLAIAIFHIESLNDSSDIDVYVTAHMNWKQ